MAVIVKKTELMCGLHSKMPMCCVFWYNNGWDGDNYNDKWYDWKRGFTMYILCPDCLVRKMEGKFKGAPPIKCNCRGNYVRWLGDPINGVQLRDDGVIIRN